MTDVAQEIKKSEKKKKTDVKKTAVKKTAVKSTKSDATLLKDAKERIMRLQVCLWSFYILLIQLLKFCFHEIFIIEEDQERF